MRGDDLLLHELGRYAGVATRAQLGTVPARVLRRAVATGAVRRDALGRYSLPGADEAYRSAVALRGARSHRSAALAYGWPVATPPRHPELVVGRGRNISPTARSGVVVRWRPVSRSELDRALTAPLRTVLDCLRDLDVEEAVPVADSALRSRLVGADELARAAALLRGPRSAVIRSRAATTDARSANPFESRLRLIARDVPGATFRPQVGIGDRGFRARVDLADVELGIVAEADSFAWHGSRVALAADARRYNELAVRGWLVLRFTYEDVFGRPEAVREQLGRAVASRALRPGAWSTLDDGPDPWLRSA